MNELEQMTRELAEKWGITLSCNAKGQLYNANCKRSFNKDLTTLLDKQRDVILADMYPKEFVEWILSQEIFFGELSEEYILNDNPGKFKTLEDVFDYWIKNVKK